HGVDGMTFGDTEFFVSEDRVRGIAEGLIAAGSPMTWWAMGTIARLVTYKESTWELMERSRCAGIFVGAESGSDETLKVMRHPSTPWLEGEQGKFLHDFERFIDYSNRVWANRAPGTVGPIAFRLLKAACEVRWNKNFFRYPYELQFIWKAGRALARLLDGEI